MPMLQNDPFYLPASSLTLVIFGLLAYTNYQYMTIKERY